MAANYEVSPLQTTNTQGPSYNQSVEDTMSNPEHLGPRLRISASRHRVNENPAPLYSMGKTLPASNAGHGDIED